MDGTVQYKIGRGQAPLLFARTGKGGRNTMDVGDHAPDFSLTAQDGSKVTLSEVLEHGPYAVLVWYHLAFTGG